MHLAIDPQSLTPWLGLWIAVLTAAGITAASLAALVLRLKKGGEAFKLWVHEFSGAAAVANEVKAVSASVTGTVTGLTAIQTSNHEANQAWLKRHDEELGAMVGAQDRLAQSVKALADEVTAESETHAANMAQMSRQVAQVSEQLERVAAIAERADRRAAGG